MRRVLLTALAATALVFVPALPASAHPDDPVDQFGGHYCRPKGSGGAECAQVGVEVGEYHCETDACRERLQDLAANWCTFGIPIPTKSNLTGIYPTGELVPPIRVVRRPGTGHVLEVRRDYDPKIQAPEACRNPDPGLVLNLPEPAAGAHTNAPERGAARVSVGPPAPRTLDQIIQGAQTGAAAVGFQPIPGLDPNATRDPLTVTGTALLAWALLRVSRRGARSLRRVFWQVHGTRA